MQRSWPEVTIPLKMCVAWAVPKAAAQDTHILENVSACNACNCTPAPGPSHYIMWAHSNSHIQKYSCQPSSHLASLYKKWPHFFLKFLFLRFVSRGAHLVVLFFHCHSLPLGSDPTIYPLIANAPQVSALDLLPTLHALNEQSQPLSILKLLPKSQKFPSLFPSPLLLSLSNSRHIYEWWLFSLENKKPERG